MPKVLTKKKKNYFIQTVSKNFVTTMPSTKHGKPLCRFIDNEAGEERDDGTIIQNFDDYDEDEELNEADKNFITDNEESDHYASDCSKVHDSEKECDEDDFILIEDSKIKASQESKYKPKRSRVVRESSSDSLDSFIDDSEENLSSDCKSVNLKIGKRLSSPPCEYEERVAKSSGRNECLRSGRMSWRDLPRIENWVRPEIVTYKPRSTASWDCLRRTPETTKKSKAVPLPTKQGIVKTSDGDYLMRNGKKHKLIDGSVCLSSQGK